MTTYTVIVKNRLTCQRDNIVVTAEDSEEAGAKAMFVIADSGELAKDYMVIKVLKGKK